MMQVQQTGKVARKEREGGGFAVHIARNCLNFGR